VVFFLYTRAIKNKQSSETGRTQDTEQGQSRINNPARQAGHKTQNRTNKTETKENNKKTENMRNPEMNIGARRLKL